MAGGGSIYELRSWMYLHIRFRREGDERISERARDIHAPGGLYTDHTGKR